MTHRLRLVFEDLDAFRREYERNISAGGAFVHTDLELELREFVEVEISLAFCHKNLVLEAEVVHALPGAVAVQFLEEPRALRRRFEEAVGDLSSPGEEGEPAIDLDALEQMLAEEEPGSPSHGIERRHGPRSRAAVPAHLETSNFHLDGHTRNLSESGVLISADASELPLGKSVTLRLQSPDTGRHIEVRGRVSRHVEADGTVAAVGVEFEPARGQQGEIVSFVSDVRRNAADRRERGISGVIEELGMANLVQMLGNTSPAGTLIVSHGAEEGVIAFEGATLRYARLGLLKSTKALTRMLAWDRGHFEFYASVDPLDDEDAPQPLDAALLESMRQIDERARLETSALEMCTTFRVERGLRVAEPEPSKIEDAVLDLCEAGFTLRRILDVIPEPDFDILRAAQTLLDLGVLVPELE